MMSDLAGRDRAGRSGAGGPLARGVLGLDDRTSLTWARCRRACLRLGETGAEGGYHRLDYVQRMSLAVWYDTSEVPALGDLERWVRLR